MVMSPLLGELCLCDLSFPDIENLFIDMLYYFA